MTIFFQGKLVEIIQLWITIRKFRNCNDYQSQHFTQRPVFFRVLVSRKAARERPEVQTVPYLLDPSVSMVEADTFQSSPPPEHCQPVDQRKVWPEMDPLGLVRLGMRHKGTSRCHLTDYLWSSQTLLAGDGTGNMPRHLVQPENKCSHAIGTRPLDSKNNALDYLLTQVLSASYSFDGL